MLKYNLCILATITNDITPPPKKKSKKWKKKNNKTKWTSFIDEHYYLLKKYIGLQMLFRERSLSWGSWGCGGGGYIWRDGRESVMTYLNNMVDCSSIIKYLIVLFFLFNSFAVTSLTFTEYRTNAISWTTISGFGLIVQWLGGLLFKSTFDV